MKLVLISGKAEAGKTTFANFLKDELKKVGITAAITPYGQYVKDTAKMLFNWDGKKDKFGRTLLQHWGTEVVRAKDPSFWIDSLARLFQVASPLIDVFIIDDARFVNEIDYWKSKLSTANYITVRIERPGWENALTEEQRRHPSETDLDNYEFDVLVKAKDKELLKENAICLVSTLRGI